MNEIELKKRSLNIEEVADDLTVCDEEGLRTTFEMIKAIRMHKDAIIDYWKNAKEAAKKAYQEISSKEKEMLEVCEKSEKILKDKILIYKHIQEKKQKELIEQAKIQTKNQVEKALSEAAELENQGKHEQAKLKLAESEKLERVSLSQNIPQKINNISTQKRWKCRVTDNKLVPCFFNGIEIREINTKKLLEVRKKDPEVNIPGIEFYVEESLVIRNVIFMEEY